MREPKYTSSVSPKGTVMGKTAGIIALILPATRTRVAGSVLGVFAILLLTGGLTSCDSETHATGKASGSTGSPTSRPSDASVASDAADLAIPNSATADASSAATTASGERKGKSDDIAVVGKKYAVARRELTAAGFAPLEVASEASTVAGDKAACPADTLICTVQWVNSATHTPLCIQVQVTGASAESDWPVTEQKNEKCYD